MKPDWQLVRLMAAVIITIIAYIAPSAVQAHEGHAHHGRQTAMAQTHAVPAATETIAPAALTRAVQASAKPWVVVSLQAEAVKPSASVRADDTGSGCCPTGCKGSCCGTMTCCASGILSSHVSLPTPAYGRVTLVAHDVAGLAGVGPEALPEPPRTLA